MRTRTLGEVLQDGRYAVRSLARTPTFTASAIISLALGIGATATVFSVVDALLLRPLPVTRPERLVTPEQMFSDGVRQYNFSHSDFERFRELTGAGVFAGVAASSWADAYDGTPGTATERRSETLRVSLVAGDYFRVLGVNLAAGRGLAEPDDRESAPPSAVIGDSYWARRFERSPDVIGRTIQLNGGVFTVIGIAPRGFSGDWVGWPTDVWVPSASAPAVFPSADGDVRSRIQYKVIARLADGVALPQAKSAAEILYQDLQQAPPRYSGVGRNARLELVSAERGYSPQRASLTQALSILACTVTLALLVICGNVANLLLVRTASRDRELAVRLSLGATRWRLVRQLMTENLLLTALGAAAGLLLAAWGTDLLAGLVRSAPVATIADGTPALELDVALDLRVVAFTVFVAVVTGVLFGFLPALRGSDTLMLSVLNRRTPEAPKVSVRARPRTILLVGQIAASTILLIGTGLFIRSVSALRSEHLGFDRQQLLLIWTLPGPTGKRGPALEAMWDTVRERLSAVPGVQGVASSVEGLLGASPGGGPLVTIEGSDQPGVRIQRTMTVAPGFFRTVGQPLLEGRDFRPDDREDSPPVVIVSESYARRAFGGIEVAGRRVRINGADRASEIVGVVADARHAGPRTSPGPMFYYPPGQNLRRLSRSMCIVVRSAVPPASLASGLRRELREVEPSLPVLRIDTIEEQLSSVLFQERLITRLAAFFATLALLLTALGLYAVLAFATERRRREIGIRLALGASPATVMSAVVREGTILVLAGLLLGIPTGVAILRLVSSRLFGVGVADPVTIAISAVVLIGIAELAVFAPAHRAARIDPAVALRME
ncbi:MAG TPA: ABC transporter permease [Vicinamibacterales bacterium]|nr:ABC transporter permease [Vicinamibacterales bacterium]